MINYANDLSSSDRVVFVRHVSQKTLYNKLSGTFPTVRSHLTEQN